MCVPTIPNQKTKLVGDWFGSSQITFENPRVQFIANGDTTPRFGRRRRGRSRTYASVERSQRFRFAQPNRTTETRERQSSIKIHSSDSETHLGKCHRNSHFRSSARVCTCSRLEAPTRRSHPSSSRRRYFSRFASTVSSALTRSRRPVAGRLRSSDSSFARATDN